MASKRVSGLSDDHAKHARKLIVKAAHLMVANKGRVHYSQRADRWVGIDRRLTVTKGQYPTTCDCSSTATWMLWDAIHRTYNVRDLVNGALWKAGYTGTQYKRGKAVVHDKNLKVGDLIFYGTQGGGIPQHVCVYVGGGKVFSHGSEAGPFILNLDYRRDRRMSRRYI
jgi:NlpC/P60 family